jgi:hypothetical protein
MHKNKSDFDSRYFERIKKESGPLCRRLRTQIFFAYRRNITGAARWPTFKQNSHFGLILEGLEMENVGTFYGYLDYFTILWYILWPFVNVVVIG